MIATPGSRRRTAVCICLALVAAGCGEKAPVWVESLPSRAVLWDENAVSSARERYSAGDPETAAAAEIQIVRAERALGNPLYSVTTKDVLPPSGDKHDFFSFHNYYWPDPDSESGYPLLYRDGHNNPQARVDFEAFTALGRDLLNLSLAYAFTEDERYAAHAARQLKSWFLDPETRMNPNCRYGKSVPGSDEGGFTVTGFESRFRVILDAAHLIAPSPSWPEDDHDGLRRWCLDFVSWMDSSPEGRKEFRAPNNHGSSFDALAAMLSWYAGDDERARAAVRHYAETRFDEQFAADGSQPWEMRRANNLEYHLVNLRIVCDLADVGLRVGDDLWRATNAHGAGLLEGILFLEEYATAGAPWPHFTDETFPVEYWKFHRLMRRAAQVLEHEGLSAAAAAVPGVHSRYYHTVLYPEPSTETRP